MVYHGRIYKKRPTISYITKDVEISRQAIHKFIKQLAAKGLVEINNVEHNKKEKCIQLTALGEDCYEKNAALKAQLENKIAEKVGVEQVKILSHCLIPCHIPKMLFHLLFSFVKNKKRCFPEYKGKQR